MTDIVILVVIVIMLLYALLKRYDPNIDIVTLYDDKFKVLLWYNSIEGKEVYRHYKVLYSNE